MASPIALGTAAATTPVTSVSIASTANAAAGNPATINATYAPQPNTPAPAIEYTVLSGPGSDVAFAGHPCTATTTGTASCSIPNAGTPGADNVRVFSDENGDNIWSGASEKFADTNVIFSGPPTALNLTPSSTTSATGSCTQYTASATDGNSNPAAAQTITLTVTESTATAPGANPITLYDATCTTASPAGGTVSGSGPFTITYTHALVVGSAGTVGFGIASSAIGTGNVAVSFGPSVSSTSSATWTAGGSNAVTTLTPTPASTTQYTGTTASYTVKATDTSGTAIQGVTVNEETTGGPDTLGATACGTTNSSGNVTCTVLNGGTAGTDAVKFWVDNTSVACAHTPGPDSCEPQGTANAVFNAAPAVSAALSTLTCVQQLAGGTQGTGQTSCTLPTSTHSVTFTATVKDASGNAISGAIVSFAASAATLGGAAVTGSNLPSGTGTTDATGVATFTVNDPTAANGDSVAVDASVGSTSVGSATAHWATPHATALTVTPALQSVTKAGTVTVKGQVTDQFGTAVGTTPTLTYLVTGRNNGKTGTAASDGTVSYTDTGIVPAGTTDSILVTDTTDGFTATATVDYITGSTAAGAVTVDSSGSGTSDGTCGATGHTAATGVTFGTATEVCAIVKNGTGEVLAGKTVTFTVSNGQVDAHGALSTTSVATYQATTDAAGVAFADVSSTTTGVQTVTAMADSTSGTGTVTYAGPSAAQAKTITVAPATATITPGGTQKFIATVKDTFGNPVSGVVVVYTQSGAGSVGGSSSGQLTTAADGTVSVNLATTSAESGSGSVTFGIGASPTVPNQCATTGGKCTATATYTVANTVAPSALTLSAETGAKAGTHETITATVTNSDGTPAANQIVRFFVKGANNLTGNGTTGAAGKATFSYLASHHGTDKVAAYVDTNNDQIREANEPVGSTTAHILGIERPTVSLTSTSGKVTIHVRTHPVAKHATVKYYVKRHGSWHKLGSNKTGSAGKAGKTFRQSAGKHTYRAKVSATSITTAGTTPAKSITVKA